MNDESREEELARLRAENETLSKYLLVICTLIVICALMTLAFCAQL